LDVVLYHEPTNKFRIIDIKTSTNGWNAKAKKDENKQFQLILYKKFFSEQFNVPLENIDIEFFIVKRKLYENTDYPIPRVQEFKPASGKVKLNKATRALEEFIQRAFDKNGHANVNHQPTPHKNCNWCPFYKTHLCSATF
jgi:RecB family exonuclease